MTRTYYNGLWICLHFQKLPIEIFTREKTAKPVVVTVKQRIVSINHSASVLGICIGNNLDTAHMLADNLVCFEKNEDKADEENRVWYVGVTRTKQNLYIMSARKEDRGYDIESLG